MPGRGAGRQGPGRGGGRGAPGGRNVQPPKYSDEDKVRALGMLARGISVRRVSRALTIPRSTLDRWSHRPEMVLGTGRCTVLAPYEEDLLVTAFNFMSDTGLPLSRSHLLEMVRSFCAATNRETPFQEDIPGRRWLEGFEARHRQRLRRRIVEHLSRARTTAMTQDNMTRYFDMLDALYLEYPIWMEAPWLIFNLDETSLACDKTDAKVYATVGRKNNYKIVPDGTKLNFTLLCCVTASGWLLPPFILYRAEALNIAWMENGAPGAGYGVSSSGWMFDINFEGWFEAILLPYVRRACHGFRVLLSYDGHNSHITYRTIEMARAHRITILCLPPNTSHVTQPLDVGVFRSLKLQWKQILTKFYMNPDNKVTKEILPSLVAQLWKKLDRGNVVTGFRKSGLHPPDRTAVAGKVMQDPHDLSNPRGGGGYALAKSRAEKKW